MKKGFTLIELLVVVLIIGILASVALPQYTVAVEKSRAMAMLPVLASLAKAEETYYLANETYTADLFALDVEPPAGASVNGAFIKLPGGQVISLAAGRNGIVAGGTRYVQMDIFLEHIPGGRAGVYCYAPTDNALAQRICKSMGRATGSTGFCGGWDDIPESTPCKQYVLN